MRGSMNGKSSSTAAQRLISVVRVDGSSVLISESVNDTSNNIMNMLHVYSTCIMHAK